MAFFFQALGFFFQTHFIIVYLWRIDSPSAISNVSGTFFLLSWGVVLALIILEKGFKRDALGTFASPLAFAMYVLSLIHPVELVPLPPIMQGVWFRLHLLCLIPGLAFFALLFGYSLMYLLQEKQIKGKILGPLFHKLPPLEDIDRMNSRILNIGFIFYTLGLVWGIIWAANKGVDFFQWPSKETVAAFNWLVYAVLLHGRIVLGWRGRKASRIAIFGFAMVVATMLFTTHSFINM